MRRKGELPTVNVTTAEMEVHIEAGVLVSVLRQSLRMLCLVCECKRSQVRCQPGRHIGGAWWKQQLFVASSVSACLWPEAARFWLSR